MKKTLLALLLGCSSQTYTVRAPTPGGWTDYKNIPSYMVLSEYVTTQKINVKIVSQTIGKCFRTDYCTICEADNKCMLKKSDKCAGVLLTENIIYDALDTNIIIDKDGFRYPGKTTIRKDIYGSTSICK